MEVDWTNTMMPPISITIHPFTWNPQCKRKRAQKLMTARHGHRTEEDGLHLE